MTSDLHSHLLCGIDDGAADLAETERLLSQLLRSGIRRLALTPHYDPRFLSLERFVEKRRLALEALLSLQDSKSLILHLGAEVYLREELMNYQSLSPLCYDETEYMLVELPYTDTLPFAAKRTLLRLTMDREIRPVIAHADRYPYLFYHPEFLMKLKEMGCLLQWNLTAFASRFARRRLADYFSHGLVDLLGEDVHHAVLCGNKREKLMRGIQRSAPDLISHVDACAASLFTSNAI